MGIKGGAELAFYKFKIQIYFKIQKGHGVYELTSPEGFLGRAS